MRRGRWRIEKSGRNRADVCHNSARMPTRTSSTVRAASGPAKAALSVDRFHLGDCLPVLAELTAKHGAFADLVYLDPPFNSARLYNHAFKGMKWTRAPKIAFHDTWKWTRHSQSGFREFVKTEAPGTDAAEFLLAMRPLLEKRDPSTLAYLTYMTRRLARIRAAMKPTASVYLHCDPTASHYLKLAMDALFGRAGFRNEVVWFYPDTPGRPPRDFPRKHDVILRYAMNPKRFVFNAEEVGVPVKPESLKHYKTARAIGGKKYVGGKEWKIPEDVWRIPAVKQNKTGKEGLGYNTQKPLALLRRIISASSNRGEVVLDPFCGCGTTIEAAHELGRRFVGIDVAPIAAQVVARRLEERRGLTLQYGDNRAKNAAGWGRILVEEQDGLRAWVRFQHDAIAAIPKAEQWTSPEGAAKQGPDEGIDGLVNLRRPSRTMSSVVIQVKRKKKPTVQDVADTALAVDNHGAFMGLLITLNPPTAGMIKRGAAEQKKFNGKYYPKVAILTYDEVKAGKFREAIPYEYAVDPEDGRQTALSLA